MAIYAISLVKNEADIIAQNLSAASRWADRIFVLDNGSSDGTWEIVKSEAQRNPVVVPFRQDPQPFRDGMRTDVFRAYRHLARRGDWWSILDADEFYIENPRVFLAQVPPTYNAVWLADYNYRFTEADLAVYRERPERFDGREPWNEVLRRYVIDEYSEYRFFRHWWGLRRLPPKTWGPIYPRRIRFRHYRYRSPEQIEARLAARAPMVASGDFLHEASAHWQPATSALSQGWRDRVVRSEDCHFDEGDESLIAPQDWTPPPSIVRPSLARYVGDRFKRIARRALSKG